ncbi:pyridoxamine 5'-phosphate oxidase [Hydrogenivirga caldilitoris]|uniref:Pyridoxamine 5'-phosphate oxidase n=1 Tax=Hydrogenivirga caldilitoris TaxID=246264 RepID=A0A497XRN4_9AQUI|nr:pyridoxamine 5'-phosphate oxidase family protein [Hydrogenivirga caldilitoris]RLJ70810.1 pyridoxamine 5'-phosphate oxidase [Hydrogenivirga caldilitoris]
MLPRELIDLMRDLGVFPVVVGTVDSEGNQHMTFITWIYPADERTLRFAVSSKAKTSENIRATGKVAVQIFAPDKSLTCYGTAKEVVSKIEGVPFEVSVFELTIDNVENSLFPGSTITGVIPFAHTGKVLKMVELDEKVMSAVRNKT